MGVGGRGGDGRGRGGGHWNGVVVGWGSMRAAGNVQCYSKYLM